MTGAIDVANYILTLVDDEAGDLISHLKLQKLLYYSQGFGLARLGHPLFEDKVVAWQHGPVVPTVWNAFNHHKSNPIPKPDGFDPSVIPEETRRVVDAVYLIYGQYSASKLRQMTHEEAPWVQTLANKEIGHTAMKIYFQQHPACKLPHLTQIDNSQWVPVTRKIIGQVFDMGGRKEPFVYLLVKDTELAIHADQKMLAKEKTNRLYTDVVATVKAEEHLDTGELRNLQLIGLDDHAPSMQSPAFLEMCSAGAIAWSGITNASEWVRERRGA